MPAYIRTLSRLLALLLLSLAVSTPSQGQNPSVSTQTVLVLPFENGSKAPGLEWIGEAFPEIIGQRLSSPSLYVISREDRLYAFDRLGIPANVRASRATLYRIAEQMDADFVVFGSFDFDGQTFTARAQSLDMKKLRLSTEVWSKGPLVNLIDVESGLAWEIVRQIRPQTTMSREEFVRQGTPVRLDAFENYIRGIIATDRAEKLRRFREAVRLNPQYTQAILQIGRLYYNAREYDSAALWLTRVSPNDPAASEANFLSGMSYYYLGQFDRAEAAFKVTAAKLPLTEVLNNLGVVSLRRGHRDSMEYFEQASQADPLDPDYKYNVALASHRFGDDLTAARVLRDTVAKHPTDIEARQLLDEVNGRGARATSAAQNASASPSSFLPRIKRNYDENSYRQVALEVQNAMEQALAKTDPKKHAEYHVEHARQSMATKAWTDAEKEFHEAVVLDPTNAEAHLGLALAAEQRRDFTTARSEARSSVQMKPSASAYLVLARVDIQESNLQQATQNVDQALWLEPNNAAALELKHQIATKSGTE